MSEPTVTEYQPIELTTPDGFELEAVCLTCGALVGDEDLHSKWHDPGPTSIRLTVPGVLTTTTSVDETTDGAQKGDA